MTRLCILFGLAICASLPASAERVRIHYATGTGFFLSAYGDLITNAHVVENCQNGTITLAGAVESPATLVAMDRKHDLALLRAQSGTPDSARLAASQSTINQGDTVMVMGYPQKQNKSRSLKDYTVKYASVIGTQGPQGEPHWLQFSDSAQHGNSGGPLLDEAGNVIGVVTGKSQLFRIDARTKKQTLMSKSDIAVTLPILKKFLGQHRIRYQSAGSLVRRSQNYVEHRARQFIAQVKCITAREHVR